MGVLSFRCFLEPAVHNNTEKWIEKVTKDKKSCSGLMMKRRVVQYKAVIERIGELTNGDAIVINRRRAAPNGQLIIHQNESVN